MFGLYRVLSIYTIKILDGILKNLFYKIYTVYAVIFLT